MSDNINVKDSSGVVRTIRAIDLSGVLLNVAMISNGAGTQLIGAQSSSGSLPVVLPTDMPLIGRGIVTPTASFTRPANTTAYASGQLVANNTVAGNVNAMTITGARYSGGGFRVNAAIIAKSGTGITNANFRVHLFDTAPTVANGDGGAFSTTGAGGGSAPTWLGSVDVSVTQVLSDGAIGRAAFGPPSCFIKKSSGQTIAALLEARGAYTPANAEVFGLSLEIEQT